MAKSTFFRAAVEGATSDGRSISRQHIIEMAESYNPSYRGARANLEHIKSLLPDSPFRAYGDIVAAKYEEISAGPLKGKIALLVQVDATEELVKLRENRQKVYTSIEYLPKFADTGKAYLTGIAFTDNPASLGAEMLTFCANSQHNPLASRKSQAEAFFSAAEEITLEFETEQKPALFNTVKALFGKKHLSDDARFMDIHQAVSLIANHQQQLTEKLADLMALKNTVTALQTEQHTTQHSLTALNTQLLRADQRFTPRPVTTGANPTHLTDC
ncbi:GPO family capsid scaffolding protein [Candidatus Fukatsuia symbiotica]|uniref:GPO family capsid scaffolding protein n=1 Tax=Candidatus Fukatsuia symbiotica TaxID=1878942 RepID=A0A2U8I6G4_9GAMM|nr:GPO family capsid scaffolding protein [Candidatus Fukatsuia symbiotica]AWK14742.1 GPO family capsid scaffolding protein [Candidatus Fukatsuia symbiotica]MEA9444389.1 GPO family capsid scaffolding protein [Candidatus Fukatsuia symbiotica]MEA9445074.1 GPO family capsid scaffolding protein [Candidatus Fukatsuia symbiotica]